jgi:hypothetical protein
MSQKLSGMSRNRFKIMPLGSRSATAGTTTNFALPENALIDTASIRVHANVTTTGGSAGAGPRWCIPSCHNRAVPWCKD